MAWLSHWKETLLAFKSALAFTFSPPALGHLPCCLSCVQPRKQLQFRHTLPTRCITHGHLDRCPECSAYSYPCKGSSYPHYTQVDWLVSWVSTHHSGSQVQSTTIQGFLLACNTQCRYKEAHVFTAIPPQKFVFMTWNMGIGNGRNWGKFKLKE